MTSQITINITHGNSFVGDDDRERAEDAALAVLAAAGVSVGQAFAVFQAQWKEFDDYDRMTGDALVWLAAQEAADSALVEGWAQPEGAGCTISA